VDYQKGNLACFDRAISGVTGGSREEKIKRLIRAEARRQGVYEPYALALIKAESGFWPFAKNPDGGVGFGQIMPETAKGLHVVDNGKTRVIDRYNIFENLHGSVKYMKAMTAGTDNDFYMATANYNYGRNRVMATGRLPAYPLTLYHCRRVFKLMRQFEKETA